ncbi:diguanylate cyclase/phosphodiesterase [Pseudomonas chlororaphis subsp. aureofaciens]|nr:EAL domain-containing response regulator [Pseudomonas chlororaphis]AZE23686.1 diguanylate cyclase/phosphodiesterase [Pseudomonas chlororaphis subsp. aureofaciens]
MDTPSILVLEDHSLQRKAAVSVLSRLGYMSIIEAADGHDAIEKIQATGGVDIALCDLDMAGMDGLTFLRQARKLDLVHSIIICSSLAEDLLSTINHIVNLQGLNLLGIITKPLCAPMLKALLLKHKSKRLEPDKSSVRSELPSESTIRRAIANQEFRAYFQPKFSLRTGEIDGAEVLARWQTPDQGLVSPALFLPAIKRYGLVNELFYNLFAQGLSLQKLMQSHGKPFKLAFNLDVCQLNNLDLVERIKILLRTHGASPQGLIFELTETGLLQIPHVGMESMVRLRMLGLG